MIEITQDAEGFDKARSILFEEYGWTVLAVQALEDAVVNARVVARYDPLQNYTAKEVEKIFAHEKATLGQTIHVKTHLPAELLYLRPTIRPVVKKRNRIAHDFLYVSYKSIRTDLTLLPGIQQQLLDDRRAFRDAARKVVDTSIKHFERKYANSAEWQEILRVLAGTSQD